MAKRQNVNFPGFAHGNPIPNASRIGNIMMSSVISGVDPGTRNLPSDLAGQVQSASQPTISRRLAAAASWPDSIDQKSGFWWSTGRARAQRRCAPMLPVEFAPTGQASATDEKRYCDGAWR